MEIVIALVIVVIAVIAIGASPLVRRTAGSRDDEMGARLGTRGLDVDVDREFRRPRDEGDLL
jgi:hypothetical protein